MTFKFMSSPTRLGQLIVALLGVALACSSYAQTKQVSGSVTITGTINKTPAPACPITFSRDTGHDNTYYQGSLGSSGANSYRASQELDLGAIEYHTLPTLADLRSTLGLSGFGTFGVTDNLGLFTKVKGLYNQQTVGWGSFALAVNCPDPISFSSIKYKVEQNPDNSLTSAGYLAFTSFSPSNLSANFQLHSLIYNRYTTSARWFDFSANSTTSYSLVPSGNQAIIYIYTLMLKTDSAAPIISSSVTYTSAQRVTFSYN